MSKTIKPKNTLERDGPNDIGKNWPCYNGTALHRRPRDYWCHSPKPCRYNPVQFITISHRTHSIKGYAIETIKVTRVKTNVTKDTGESWPRYNDTTLRPMKTCLKQLNRKTRWREMDLMILEKVDRVITGQHCIVGLGITGVTRPSPVVITRSSLSQYHNGQITAVEQN